MLLLVRPPDDRVSKPKLQDWILEAVDHNQRPISAREVVFWMMEADKIGSTVGMENKVYSLMRRLEDQGILVSQGWKGSSPGNYIWCRRFSRGTALDQLAKVL